MARETLQPGDKLYTAQYHEQCIHPSRRKILQGFLAGLFSLYWGGMARVLDNLILTHHLSNEHFQELLQQAAMYPPQELGIHPDFDLVFQAFHQGWISDREMQALIRRSVGAIEPLQQSLPEQVNTIGVFVRMEEVRNPEHWQRTQKLLKAVFEEAQTRKLKVLINYGIGGGAFGGEHPLDQEYEQQLLIWNLIWAYFLQQYQHQIKAVRPLFEPNLFQGDIGYRSKGNWVFDPEHAERFREFFDQIYEGLKHILPATEIHVSLAAFGWDYQSYLPPRHDGVGMDLYDMSDPATELSAYNLILGRRHAADLRENSLAWLAEQPVPTYLHEIGSKTQDMAWLLRAFLEFFANGGDGAMLFLVNKGETDEAIDWQMSIEKLQEVLQLYHNINYYRLQYARA